MRTFHPFSASPRYYRESGLSALTEPRTGPPLSISGDALAQVLQELQNERGFSSYLEVQFWLAALWDEATPLNRLGHPSLPPRCEAEGASSC
ncbi:hypothetical protein [Rubidibacter lacunae]|uniref:hypothetical protein n=1 Tax=Rubidibacter lacunae TaxID=582514 RepID=UPI0004110A3B|nr:hypothetical protein [Rubidibacter lacunae]